MNHLLNVLAAIALLVWGTHIVRTSMLEAFGEPLRQVLANSLRRRAPALLAGLGVASLLQSATATWPAGWCPRPRHWRWCWAPTWAAP